MREELAVLLVRATNDPRLSGVSITDVEVDRELAYATIFYSSIEGATRAEEIQAGFEHAQGFLRSELAHRISLRTFPRLRFRYDPTFERAENIEQLLNSLDQDTKPNGERE
jgi:ribosome-binding factor A